MMQHAAYSISQLQAHVLPHDQNLLQVYKSSVRQPPVWSTETRILSDFTGVARFVATSRNTPNL